MMWPRPSRSGSGSPRWSRASCGWWRRSSPRDSSKRWSQPAGAPASRTSSRPRCRPCRCSRRARGASWKRNAAGGSPLAEGSRPGCARSAPSPCRSSCRPCTRWTSGRSRSRPAGSFPASAARGDRSGIVLPTPWTQASGMAFTVWDEVAFGPANLGWPTHEIARQVDRALEQLELVPLASRDPATLSGGELQRVIIASILAMDPGLVLFDEPAAELDAEAARALWRLIPLPAQEGKAVLLATSALDALPDVADRVVWLEDGAVRAIGTPELLADVAACDAGLGTSVASVWWASGLPGPYPLTLAHALQRWR